MRKHWKKIALIVVLLILIILAVVACSSGLGRSGYPNETTLPTEETTAPIVETTAPIEETTAPTEEAAEPTEETTAPTEPEATDPPVTEPLAAEPPATEAPVVQAPPQQPTYTAPPATEPPAADPPATEPLATESSATEPPATEPPATQPPVAEHEHNYHKSVWVTPTCTGDGYNTYVCADCGHSYTEMLPATGHSWGEPRVTKQPTVDSEGVETVQCRDCSFMEDRTIDKLSPPDPAQCEHAWEMIYHPEEGHYGDEYILCVCGARFNTEAAWGAHIESFSAYDALMEHGGWGTARDFIVDLPEYYEWVCSNCGASTLTEP